MAKRNVKPRATQPGVPSLISSMSALRDPSKRQRPQWQLLTDDTWAQIMSQMTFHDKLRLQQTCRRFCGMLAHPYSTNIWGRVHMPANQVSTSTDVWRVCKWVQQRVEGISAVQYTYSNSEDTQQRIHAAKVWHGIVASTAGTGVRLKMCANKWFPPCNVLQPPSHSELVLRLTALEMNVARAADIAVVHSLSALRHLLVRCSDEATTQLLQSAPGHVGATGCQLSSLCTLQLVRMPPAAFFVPGTAAKLRRLHSLSLDRCLLSDSCLPSDVLQLQALSRLDLLQLPLRILPDLRQLPALRTLVLSRKGCRPLLDASQAECSAELKAALIANPLGGAEGLTEAVLHNMPITTRACAEAVERLPHLKTLALEFLACDAGAFWAATLQQRMQGRCSIEPASEFITPRAYGGAVMPVCPWPNTDW